MSALLRQAAVAAGMLDLDCLKLVPFSREDPHAQIAELKEAKPDWFHDAPALDARTMSQAEFEEAKSQIIRDNRTRENERAAAVNLENMRQRFQREDEARAQHARDVAARQEAEQRRLAERHAAQRGR